jgi:predicted nucleic-acid-binding protein
VITLDTNIWVRYLTNDDPIQAGRALQLLKNSPEIFIPKTVLLELEWVLRAVYAQSPDAVEKALRHLLGLPNVQAEAPEQIAATLDLYQNGLDFADALHLCSGEVDAFYTFDRAFISRAKIQGTQVLAP